MQVGIRVQSAVTALYTAFDQSYTEVQGGKLHRGTARRPHPPILEDRSRRLTWHKAKASTVSLLERDRLETG